MKLDFQKWLATQNINYLCQCDAECAADDLCAPYQGLCIAKPPLRKKSFLVTLHTEVGQCPNKLANGKGCSCQKELTFANVVAIGLGSVVVAIVGYLQDGKVLQFGFDLRKMEDVLFFDPTSVGKYQQLVIAYGKNIRECRQALETIVHSQLNFRRPQVDVSQIVFKENGHQLKAFEDVVPKLRTLKDWNGSTKPAPPPSQKASSPRKPLAPTTAASPQQNRGRGGRGGGRAGGRSEAPKTPTHYNSPLNPKDASQAGKSSSQVGTKRTRSASPINNDDDDDTDLPDGWFSARTPDGVRYFYTATGRSQWHKPTQPASD